MCIILSGAIGAFLGCSLGVIAAPELKALCKRIVEQFKS